MPAQARIFCFIFSYGFRSAAEHCVLPNEIRQHACLFLFDYP